MTDREALVAAIAADPADDTRRLVAADWFEENGQPERAALVRLQCEAARLRPGDARRAELLRRCDDLHDAHEPDWLGDWHGRLIDWRFRRGFVRSVRMPVSVFLDAGEALFRAEPVERLELTGEDGGRVPADAVRAAVAHPAFARVQDCAVWTDRWWNAPAVDDWLRALADAPHVTRLRSFGPASPRAFDYLFHRGIDPVAFVAFCRAPHLRTLAALDFGRCRIGPAAGDRVAPALAEAAFARNLRRLRCTLNERGVDRLSGDPVFSGLRQLNVCHSSESPTAWAGLFVAEHLAGVRDLTITVNHLPQYARSPMADRVRRLTVRGWEDLARDTSSDARAWGELIDTARRPTRLNLEGHNPGREVFAQMIRRGWLRRVRSLAMSGDSQDEVYAGRTAGVAAPFRSGVLPRLAELDLHEVADRRVLAALAEWPGLPRLERLQLTDDYNGRLDVRRFTPAHPLTGLRRLDGLWLQTDADADRFLAFPGLDGLRDLGLTLVGEHRGGAAVQLISNEAAVRLLRSPALSRLRSLALSFDDLPALIDHVFRTLADPAVLPRLRTVQAFANVAVPEAVAALRGRFGPRLTA